MPTSDDASTLSIHPQLRPDRRSTTPGALPPVAVAIVLIAITLLAGGLLGVASRQDTNFDQLRQHYYGWWWLLHGRAHTDFFPAAEGGLLPNGWNLPWYLLVGRVSPTVTMGYLGALSSVAALLLAVLCWRLIGRALSVPLRLGLVALALVIGLTGPSFVGEFATTFGDIPTALPFLTGLIVLLWTGKPSARRGAVFAAFVLIGMAPGLKPTNTGWAAAAVVALLCSSPPRGRWARTAWSLAGAAVGAGITFGPWAVVMWRRYRSPTFPLLNRFFHSPDYEAVNFRDRRWMLSTPLDVLRLPLRWLSTSQVSSEVPMRDWRWAMLLTLAVVAFAVRGWRGRGRSKPTILDPSAATFVIVLVLAGFLLSLLQIAYTRYLLIGELLSPLVFIAIFDSISSKVIAKVMGMAVVAGVIVVTTHAGTWGRADLTGSWFRISTAARPTASIVFVIDQDPYQYLLPYLGSSNRYIMVGDSDVRFGRVYRQVQAEVRAHPRRSYLLSAATSVDQLPASVARDLEGYGLGLEPSDCSPMTSIRGPTWLCELRPI